MFAAFNALMEKPALTMVNYCPAAQLTASAGWTSFAPSGPTVAGLELIVKATGPG